MLSSCYHLGNLRVSDNESSQPPQGLLISKRGETPVQSTRRIANSLAATLSSLLRYKAPIKLSFLGGRGA